MEKGQTNFSCFGDPLKSKDNNIIGYIHTCWSDSNTQLNFNFNAGSNEDGGADFFSLDTSFTGVGECMWIDNKADYDKYASGVSNKFGLPFFNGDR